MATPKHIRVTITQPGQADQIRWYSYDADTTTCGAEEVKLRLKTTAQLLALSAIMPTPAADKVLEGFSCTGADVITDVETLDPNDLAGNGLTPPATLLSASGNPGVYEPRIEWQNGLARINYGITPTLEANETLYVFIDGHRETIPTPYGLQPGASLGIVIGTAPLPYLYQNGYRQRACALIVIPNPPTS